MKDYPFIKLAISFTIGILVLPVIRIDLFHINILALVTIVLFIYSFRKEEFKNYRIILSFLLILIFVGVGNILAQLNEEDFNKTLTEVYKEKNVVITGEVQRIELFREKEILFYVETESFKYRDTTLHDNITLLCKIRVHETGLRKFYEYIELGNQIELRGTYTKGRDRRNPGEFNYDKYLKSKGITGIVTVNKVSDYRILSHSAHFFGNAIFQTRKFIDERITLLHSKETAALLRGLLLADRREINEETKSQFINSGVIHVLAVSGLHVGFIAFIFFFLFGRLNIYIRSTLTVIGLLIFMFITGIPPSVFRATVMAIIIITGFLYNRTTNIFNSLALAAFIILAVNPMEIYSPGFQLSFSAVFAIGAFYPPLSNLVKSFRIKHKLLNYLILFLCVSFSAQLGTVPFVLIYFGKISIVALIVNLLVIPAIGLIIALAIVAITLSIFLPFAAVYYSAVNDFITYLLLNIIAYSGDLSFSKIDIISYSFFDAIVYYVSILILFITFSRFKNILAKSILVVFTIVNLFLFSSLDDRKILPDNKLSVFMIDVGQGDAFLIRFPNGITGLVDAGKASMFFDNGEKIILPLLRYMDIDDIDFGFVSHLDIDHYGGFISLIESGKIKEIYKPSIDTAISKDIKFEEFIKKNSISINNYKTQSIRIGNCMIYVLNDDDKTKENNFSSNDRSAVFKLVYGRTSFLFTGDAGKKVERILVNKFSSFLNSDVLKVGHHGSKTSSSDNFLSYVSPDFALISAGIQNSFNHPSDEIVSKFNEVGTKLLRTDRSGGVLLISDGNYISVDNY